MTVDSTLESLFFTVDAIVDGVFAAIAKPGTGAMANAGIIDLGDQTLIFDTMYTPSAGKALSEAAVQIFQRPVSIVINSHFHMDHVGGNQSFPGAQIISTSRTRSLMLERTQQFLSFALNHPEYPASIQATLEQETDVQKRHELSIQLGDVLAMDSALPTLTPTPATLTFESSLTLHGSKRSVVLTAMGNGHSPCDSILYLPEDEIVFAADLLFVQSHPSVQSSNVYEWILLLERLAKYEFGQIVPGHGHVSNKQAVTDLWHYLTDLQKRARFFNENQIMLHAESPALIPVAYQNWSTPSLYERNLSHMLNQLQASNQK
ncbi:MBL fold metallo-hydrolase [Brevibacillus centrosporus]|uniref:MBL fold metallo-hydrolase n=1 Tax=Brevibacillus centrosporus TaxID=54910 RepID=UPI002E1BB5CB|nr:MBL fold metallo-hydrolase [Brevibacillus centrosporus]